MYWTTKSGHKLKITEMTSDHIRNAIKYLENKGTYTVDLGGVDITEIGRYEEDWTERPIYKALYNELERRVLGLSQEPLQTKSGRMGKFKV